MSLVRYLAVLSCAHQIALEEKPPIGTREYCPECGDNHVIVRVKRFIDDEVA